MDGASLAPFPHYSWFGVRQSIVPDARPVPVQLRQVNHVLFYAERALARVQWICRGRERHFEVPEAAVHFAPADGEEHVRIPRVPSDHDYLMVLIPPRHLDEVVSSEGCRVPDRLEVMVGRHDAVLKTCVTRLFHRGCPGEAFSAVAVEESSRLLLLRLAELNGGGRPDWSCDTGVFDRRMMSHLADRIDDRLPAIASLDDLAALVGLSPSHFARKFRLSTGLSLHRFINRRKILRSLEALRTDSPLVSIALDLGFSSQSHFTRLFSALTGMTPARYRRQFRRTVG